MLRESFNSRVRGGRDCFSLSGSHIHHCFNSRVRGGRDLKAADYGLEASVSTHASAGDATCATRERYSPKCFNSRVRGGRDGNVRLEDRDYGGFNSRVRGGRDASNGITLAYTSVSTHASAGDATGTFRLDRESMKFQLTRPRGTRPPR